MVGGYLNQLWDDEEPPDTPRYLPFEGTFPDNIPNSSGPELHQHRPQFPVQLPHPQLPHAQQYAHPEQLFQQAAPLIPLSAVEDLHEPYTSSTFQDPFNRAFITNQPVVHEGYIPAPGTRDEDLYPSLPDGYRDSLFQDSDDSSDESDFERRLAEAEELREIEDKDDSEADANYSEEDAEQDEGDPNEMEIDEAYVEERAKPKRGRGSARGMRGGRRGRPPGRAKGGFHGPTRKQLRGKKNPGRPSGKRGPRPIADPGPEFKSLQRAANERFIARDYPAALEYGQKAVQLNPEIFDAHNIVAESYAAMGEELKSIESLIIGAPTKRDPELWHLIIERIKRLDTTDHPTYTEQVKTAVVLQCLKSIIALDVTNYEARSLKLEIEARLGHVSKCVNLGTKMLKTLRDQKQDPDTEVLKIMAMMGTSTPKQTKRHLPKIIEEFDQAIDIYTGPARDPKDSDLDWELINIYLDLLDRSGRYEYALKRLKDLSRWKQGRRNETYWDEQKDDCEFDIEDTPRRVDVFDFKRKSKSAKYGETLPLEIRVKMGLFRLRKSPDDYAEAMHHLDMLEPDDKSPDALMWDYLDLFRVIADALHSTGHDAEALRFYEPLLLSNSSEMSLMSYLGLYTVYTNLQQPEKARQIIPILIGWTADTVDDLAVLAKFFEVQGMPDEAMERADACYRNRGLVKLRRIGYSRLREIRSHYEDWRRKSRGNHGKKKNALKKQRKLMKKAIAALDDDAEEDEDADKARPSLGPLKERPAKGLFRTRRIAPKPPKTQTFLPFDAQQQGPSASKPRVPEPSTLEGTDVPMDAIDHRLFRKKLQKLAEDNADDVAAARAQHREIVASFRKLDDVYDSAEAGDEESIQTVFSITRELIEEFSSFDLFYADRKEEFKGYFRRVGGGEIWKDSALMVLAVAANAIEDGAPSTELRERPDTAPTDFWSIPFSSWCDAFARYALLLAKNGDDAAFSTLDIALQSNVFARSLPFHRRLETTRLAAALALDDSTQASAAIRWFLREFPFGTTLFRLYSAVNRLVSFPEGYATGPAHKVLMRYIKTADFALLTPDQRTWYNFRSNERVGWGQNGVNSSSLDAVHDHDPALFALYAHVLASGGSYAAALNYYFRAFALSPADPVLNLAIGSCYIQHAMKRLSENRQFQIQQGLAFVYRYFDLRVRSGKACFKQEAEFNVGRVWHALGLGALAVPAYERCIQLSGAVRSEAQARRSEDEVDVDAAEQWGCEDFTTEAAYALQSIYAVSGNLAAARDVTRDALVLE
ncbi:TPR-like protein [Didymella exigua CBS 183.55]|uniref:TPR-like protein n=1 Tax=Didymella exigua CBS 183.55 TaxID=1150837 RepID=A0A6A5RKA0_9PLEO|nr:TPR-like protein [Didymella exigua CBS 183.55]KAF1928805.1 TPR-like protein [Didymella exigua CBS 183.55]